MPKLDFCQTKQIILATDFVFERETLDKIIQPSLEKVYLQCYLCKDVNPGLLVLQKCPNIKRISIRCFGPPDVPILTNNILKEMLKTKRGKKIELFDFEYVSEIDPNDLIKLMDNHLDPISFIYFLTLDAEFDACKQMFTKIQEIRPKIDHGIQIELESISKSYKTFL
uniref:Uncharacterized protein n=1 Tax=Panagrolaimus davidi TaxID=227884 RepID=A0A914QJH2_9BILA